jgi:hypothetical protein
MVEVQPRVVNVLVNRVAWALTLLTQSSAHSQPPYVSVGDLQCVRLTASMEARPLYDLVAESERVLAAARGSAVKVRLAGGLAIRQLCPSARKPPLQREYHDIDLAIAGDRNYRSFTDLMVRLGYEPDTMFNTLSEGARLRYIDMERGRHVDVFVNAVRMCHVIDFERRIALLEETLTPTDLLLTKLQIVQLNEKDVLDMVALLQDQRVEVRLDPGIDSAYLTQVWADDWPLWNTSRLTLDKIRQALPSLFDGDTPGKVVASLGALDRIIDSGRKSLRWKVRARVGERIRWYELPEEEG